MELSDYLAITEAHRDDDGLMGGNGFLWVILIFLFFLAFNGGGLFGFGNRGVVAEGGLAQTQRDILTSSCETQKGILQAQYDTQLGFANINQNIAALGFQMQQCCCDLKTQMLQDKYDAAQNELMLARNVATNQTQTQNVVTSILNAIGTYRTNPPYNPCGCGCSGNI